MATTTQYNIPQDSRMHHYGAQPYSPLSSASGTPMDTSPTSPRNPSTIPNLPFATRQRALKSPMYVPAVLRPTERPHRQSPLTPPRSMHGSTDSLEDNETPTTISRQSTAESKRRDPTVFDEEPETKPEPPVNEDLEIVSGPPTRDHWKLDANALVCDGSTCQKSFSLFERRHHCRHCGHVFCNAHSRWMVPLNQNAEFHPGGAQYRACQHCANRYKQWDIQRITRPNTAAIPGSSAASAIAVRTGPEGQKTVASSVPKDWSWSTF